MASKIVAGQTYVFISWADLMVVDLKGGLIPDETPVISFKAHLDNEPRNQVWKAESSDNGSFFLINTKAGSFLDLYGGKKDGKVQGFKGNGGANQKWSFASASQGDDTPSFFIKSEANGQAVTIPGGSTKSVQLQCLDIGSGQDANWSRWVAIPFNV